MIQPAYVLREEALLPDGDLTEPQKKKAGPEDILVVCRHCAENCFGGGVVSIASHRRACFLGNHLSLGVAPSFTIVQSFERSEAIERRLW